MNTFSTALKYKILDNLPQERSNFSLENVAIHFQNYFSHERDFIMINI